MFQNKINKAIEALKNEKPYQSKRIKVYQDGGGWFLDLDGDTIVEIPWGEGPLFFIPTQTEEACNLINTIRQEFGMHGRVRLDSLGAYFLYRVNQKEWYQLPNVS